METSLSPGASDGDTSGRFATYALRAKFRLLCDLMLNATDKRALRREFNVVSVTSEDAIDSVLGIGRTCFDRSRGAILFTFSNLLQEPDNLSGSVLAQDEYGYPFSLSSLKDPRTASEVCFGCEN
jgi:hypothetical protein